MSLLARIERELGVRLPAEYWNGLAADQRLVVAGPRQGEEIWLYPVPELSGINAAAELPGRLPGLVIIGTDGSRESEDFAGVSDSARFPVRAPRPGQHGPPVTRFGRGGLAHSGTP